MGFLSPWFLAGMVAVGLPLWLHLLRQFRRTPRPFSSLMFFERRVQSSTKHRRLRYLALLAMRLALLILLALAFANPFVNRTSAQIKRRGLAVIAVDRSFSMRYSDRLAQAKLAAERMIDGLPARSGAEILAVDAHVESLTRPETDKGILRAAVESIQPTDQTSSFGEFSRALRVMDQTTGMRLEAHLFSDVQQTSMPANFRDLEVGPHTSLAIHPAVQGNAPNWAVENVTAPAHVFDPNQVRVTATIAGWQTPPAAHKVSLLLDGKVVATKQVTVPDCGRTQVEFLGFPIPYGVHHGELRLEPHDKLPQDDSFAFAMERSDPRRVLFLYARGRSKDAFFYKAAMESSNGTGLTVQSEPLDQAPGEDFSKYAFVVLNDPGSMDKKLERDLCNWVSKGGAVLMAAGPETAQAEKIPLAAELVSETSQTQGAGLVDNGDAALLGAGQFQNVQFFKTARITLKPTARLIARFADGTPLLFEQPSGEGRILVFASTLDNSMNDFPVHASFLPFVVQTGAYLSGAEDTPSSVAVGSPVTLRRTQGQTTAADVIGPDGKHELSLREAARALSYDLPQEGFYEVQRADGRRVVLAAHADRRESDLTPVPADTLELWRNTGEKATDPVSGAADQETRPYSLWRYVLALVLLAALIESIFANRYLRGERQTA